MSALIDCSPHHRATHPLGQLQLTTLQHFSPLALFVSVFAGFCHYLRFAGHAGFCFSVSAFLLPLLLTFSSPYFLIFSSVCSFLLPLFSVPLCFIPRVFRFLLHWVSCVSVSVVFLWGTSPSSSVTMYQLEAISSLFYFPLPIYCFRDILDVI